jgi:hypothetical protein
MKDSEDVWTGLVAVASESKQALTGDMIKARIWE